MTAEAKKTPAVGTLKAYLRKEHGKGSSRALRREGKVPAVIYGKGQQPMSVALYTKEVTMEYARGRFRNRVLTLALENNETLRALPKDVQFNPVSDKIEHIDFIKVDAGTVLRVMIPVKFTGQEKSVGLKRGGVLNVVRHEIEFFCPAENIPSQIEINIQDLNIAESVHINDIKLPEGVKPTIKRNFTVAAIAGRRAEEEAKPAEAASAPAAGAAAAPADAKKDDAKK